MKIIPLEQLEHHLGETLQGQSQEEPILLTRGDDALGLLLKLPDGTKGAEVQDACWLVSTSGMVGIVQVNHGDELAPSIPLGKPVFGRCQGMLTAVAEDDEHLRDFVEYMP
jgi:hypothetical protein